ncbi:unnamed protein product, partial [Urochloa humidicola]
QESRRRRLPPLSCVRSSNDGDGIEIRGERHHRPKYHLHQVPSTIDLHRDRIDEASFAKSRSYRGQVCIVSP